MEVPAPSSLAAVARHPGKTDPVLEARIKEAVKTKFTGKQIHSDNNLDREPYDWPELYKYKLLFCYKPANFQAETKKEPAEV